MKNFHPTAEGVAEPVKAQRHHHELLHVHVVVRVGAAVDDVHHGSGQPARRRAAQVSVQRQPAVVGGGVGQGERDAQNGIGPQVAFVGRAVEFDQHVIDFGLVESVETDHGIGQLLVDVGDGRGHALAAVGFVMRVPQFPGFVLALAGAAGYGGAAKGAVRQSHFYLDRGVATAVEDLSADNFGNCRIHGVILA